ncbi:MAG: DUF2202 domain-containing protein [Fimbriimonadaceae bacterium]|nr:DUF2202 domain-containing protein [Fimbriimonadaceae bacterium]
MKRSFNLVLAAAGSTTLMAAALTAQVGGESTLSQAETEGLKFMREEEKLARDVYHFLAEKWGDRPFGNIAQSEQTHMDAVKTLLDRHAIADPASPKPGDFNNPDLQKLYDDFVKRGRTSRIEALKVGATIEDLDLYDLARWQEKTTASDVRQVFSNLERGSRNHLRSFVSVMRRQGVTYKPQFLTQAEFDKIIDSPMERGRGF